MKVLIIAQYFPPDMGGGATRAYNMAKGLSLAECDVTVVTAFPHYPTGNIPAKYNKKLLSVENEGKIRIIRTYVPPIASEGFAKRIILFTAFVFSSLSALPITRKVNAIWASNPNIIGMIPSLIYKRIKKCPLIQNVDDLWPEALYDLGMDNKSLTAKLGELLAKITYRFASAITPISPAYVDILTKKYNVAPSKISIIPAGVDLSIFSCKSSHRTKDTKFRVLYIGAFSPAYNFDQIFQAAELLVNCEEIEFVIQGGGELASALKSTVEKLRPTNVKVIDKIVSRQDVVKELYDADALLLPLSGIGSIEMGISSKLYEYQAAGKPIICCSNGQPARYISETDSGIVVKPGDYETLAKAVTKLRDDFFLARAMGENGRKYVESEASVKAIGLKMKEMLKKITQKRSSSVSMDKSIEDEIHVYDNAEVFHLTGETESYDAAFFPNVIRKRELELIRQVLQTRRPKLILDYGCGGGWLSLLLLRWGFDVVGLDVSKNMVKSAKRVCHEADFIVCDAMRLPFTDGVFDFTIGISILHHLNLKNALNELKRISLARSVFLFMEPNSLNPLSAFGRKVFPMEAHTKREKPFTPEYLKTALNLNNLNVERFFAIFFLAFPVARFSKIIRINPPSSLVKMTYLFEKVMEKMPAINYLNSNIVVIGKR